MKDQQATLSWICFVFKKFSFFFFCLEFSFSLHLFPFTHFYKRFEFLFLILQDSGYFLSFPSKSCAWNLREKLARGRPKSILSRMPDVWPQCLLCPLIFKLHCTCAGLEQLWSFQDGFLFHFWLFLSIGRAGRVSAGTCFRLVTREFYENALPEFGVPEMQVGSRTDSLPKSWSM